MWERNINWLPTGCIQIEKSTRNLGMCPDWEWNSQPLGYRTMLQPTETYQQGSFHFLNMALQRYGNFQLYLRKFNHHIARSEIDAKLSYTKYKIIVKPLNISGRKYYIWFKVNKMIISTKRTKAKKQLSFLFGWYSSFVLISKCQHLDLKIFESNIYLIRPIC